MKPRRPQNPFVFGEIVDRDRFINRTMELQQLVRDMADGQKVFLLSPRRFGKSSLVHVAFRLLADQDIRTVVLPVSDSATYAEFLERFAERVLRAAGPWGRTKDWIGRFLERITPEINVDLKTGEFSFSLGKGATFDPAPVAPQIFALPGQLTQKGNFRMAICLDEFQQISEFDGRGVENALRNAVQHQRRVGYVFSGSQPSLMEQMLSPKRPFHKAGPKLFLDKIPAKDWKVFVLEQFARRHRTLTVAALDRLLASADLIPYDVQRMAHELWDLAELEGKATLEPKDVDRVIESLVAGQSDYYERLWQQLSARQRSVLQALSQRGSAEIYSQTVREQYRLGPASSVQTALASLDSQDILDRYQGDYFFLDPLFSGWIVRSMG